MTPSQALKLILDQIDYTSPARNCNINEQVGAVLTPGVISRARAALEEHKRKVELPMHEAFEAAVAELNELNRTTLFELYNRVGSATFRLTHGMSMELRAERLAKDAGIEQLSVKHIVHCRDGKVGAAYQFDSMDGRLGTGLTFEAAWEMFIQSKRSPVG